MTEPAANPDDEALPRKIDAAEADAQAEALDQAEEYQGLFAPTPLTLDNGDVIKIPPHPEYGMLPDEAMDLYDELLFMVDTVYERDEDVYIPEQKLDNGITLPATTQRGALKRPFRIKRENGVSELVKPSHTTKLVRIALGDDYEKLKPGGKSSADVWKIWQEQSLRIRERQARDSKSASGPVAVAPVPKANG